MKYIDIVTYNLQHNLCPFCWMTKEFIVEQSKYFYVIWARAPYTEDHLLIIPNRHVVLFNSLSREEVQDLMSLVARWDSFLHKKYSDVALLLRDGFTWWKWGKSVDHMHFHLIPDMEIWSMWSSWWVNRKYLTEKEVIQRVKAIKKLTK